MIVLSGRHIVTLASIALCLFVGTILCAISGTKMCYSANITACALAGTSRCVLEGSVMCPSEDRTMCAFAEAYRCVFVGTIICVVAGTTVYFLIGPAACICNTVESPASKKFKTTLQNEMKKRGVLVKEVNHDFEETDLPNTEQPFIVVCNNPSRIEADIESSLKTIKGIICSRIIFVVLNVVRKDMPQTTYTKDLQGARACFKKMNIDTVIDMAFTIEDGIYKCKMNERAFKELSEVFELNKISLVLGYLMGIMRRIYFRNNNIVI